MENVQPVGLSLQTPLPVIEEVHRLTQRPPSSIPHMMVYLVDRSFLSRFMKTQGIIWPPGPNHFFTRDKQQNERLIRLQNVSCALPRYEYLTYYIDPQWNERDIFLASHAQNESFKKHIPDYVEIARVLFRDSEGPKLERVLPLINVIFANAREPGTVSLNTTERIKTVQFSRFMTVGEFSEYLHAVSENRASVGEIASSTEEAQLFKVDSTILPLLTVDFLARDTAQVKLLARERLLYEEMLSIDVCLVFLTRPPQLISLPQPQPAPLDEEKCAHCGRTLTVDVNGCSCSCGKDYCSQACQERHVHVCIPRTCHYCAKAVAPYEVPSVCPQCGVVYCSEVCKMVAGHPPPALCRNEPVQAAPPPAVPLEVAPPTASAENDGLVGIANVGNSCYMGSALQVLLHDAFLKTYLLSDAALSDVNALNPLGTRGELLRAARDFFAAYWFSSERSVSPASFKQQIVRHLPTFDGYAQHDAQEFLSQLLDALHEDTNRVLHKPVVAAVEGRAGDENLALGRQSWVSFLRRNHSTVVHRFFGQYRSVVQCDVCGFSSLTFEPFQLLSLPISSPQSHAFYLYHYSDAQPAKLTQFRALLESSQQFNDITVRQIVEGCAEHLDKPADSLRLVVTTFGPEVAVLEDSATVGRVQEALLYKAHSPELFLIELSPLDVYCLAGPDPLLVTFSTLLKPPEPAREPVFPESDSSVKNAPLFTKLFYLTGEHSIEDLHLGVLQKLFAATDLEQALPEDVLEEVQRNVFNPAWHFLQTAAQHRFFNICFEGKLLTDADMPRKLSELRGTAEGPLHVTVFIRKEGCKTEVNLRLLMNFDTVKEPIVTIRGAEAVEEKDLSLQKLLLSLSKLEELKADNLWFCGQCKEHVRAHKKLSIFKAPEVLVIQLKRVKSLCSPQEIQFDVDELDLSTFVMDSAPTQAYAVRAEEILGEEDLLFYSEKGKNPLFELEGTPGLRYRLTGVVNHMGSQSYGHYYTYQLIGSQWYEFNDTDVTTIEKKDLVTKHAYILVYEKIAVAQTTF